MPQNAPGYIKRGKGSTSEGYGRIRKPDSPGNWKKSERRDECRVSPSCAGGNEDQIALDKRIERWLDLAHGYMVP